MYTYDRRVGAEEVPGTADFVKLLNSLLDVGDRQIRVQSHKSWSGRNEASVRVEYVNLPKGYGGAGGGAEAENNRFAVQIDGFASDGPPPGKIKAETSVAHRREFRMRGKTGTPEQVARYVAAYFNHLAKNVEPNYTHSEPPKT